MSGQEIKPGQQLTEQWEIGYTKMRGGSPIVASLRNWPNTTMYAARGEGDTVEKARLELVSNLARAIHEDPNPFGDLGDVVHVADVLGFLHNLLRGPSGEGAEYDPGSDHFLPDNLMKEETLPEGWEKVVNSVITAFQSWADYWPDPDPEVEEASVDG